MADYFILYLIGILAVLTASYVNGFIFALFRADRYEDELADKIVKKIKESSNEK